MTAVHRFIGTGWFTPAACLVFPTAEVPGMELVSRRSFNRKMLGSLLAYGLVETVFSRGLLADSVKPVVHQWMVELNNLCRDLKDRKMKDVGFQGMLEELYRKVDLA